MHPDPQYPSYEEVLWEYDAALGYVPEEDREMTHTLHTEDTPYGTYAYCDECHNPDELGVGRCDYYGFDMSAVKEWFDEHRN